MRRSSLALSFLIGLSALAPAAAAAQPEEQVIDLDDDPRPPIDEVVVPGPPSKEASRANQLFEAGRWEEATIALQSVVDGETGDDEGNKQVAQLRLAVSLFNLRLYEPSYAIFSEIALRPTHQKHAETLLWLARLAAKLPEPAGVIDMVGRYAAETLDRFDNAEQRPLRWQLAYLLGRHAYEIGDYASAIARFGRVGAESPYGAIAKYYVGLSHVQLRRGKKALESFEATLDALANANVPQLDADVLGDLANLGVARVHYTLAFRQRREGDYEVSTTHMRAALAGWDRIPISSPFAADAFYERGRAHYALGDLGAALGDIESSRSPLVAHVGFVKSDGFEIELYGSLCDRSSVATLGASLHATWDPVRAGLADWLFRYDSDVGEEQLFRDFRWFARGGSSPPVGRAPVQPETAAELARLLGKRDLLRELDWVDEIDAEEQLFKTLSSDLRASPAGDAILDGLDLARQIAIRRAATRVARRVQERVDELDGTFGLAETIAKYTPKPLGDPAMFHVDRSSVTDDTGEIERWPVDGEAWADEVGTYKAVVISKCAPK